MRFGVMDTRGNENVTAQRVIPLKCLRPGKLSRVYIYVTGDGATLRSLQRHVVMDEQSGKNRTFFFILHIIFMYLSCFRRLWSGLHMFTGPSLLYMFIVLFMHVCLQSFFDAYYYVHHVYKCIHSHLYVHTILLIHILFMLIQSS